jgi:putative transferase (TIGR04331 family)
MRWLVIGRHTEFRNVEGHLIFINDWSHIADPFDEKIIKSHEVANFPVENQAEILGVLGRARMTEEYVFPRLCNRLNLYHGLDKSERFWKILIGAWLRRVIELYCFREFHILRCVEKYSIDNIKIVNGYKTIEPNNYTIDLLELQNNEDWNVQVTSRIIKNLNIPNVTLHEYQQNPCVSKFDIVSNANKSINRSLPKKIKDRLKKVALKLQKNTDAVFLSTYLGVRKETLLSLGFKQFPQFHSFPKLGINQFKERQYRSIKFKELFQYEDFNEMSLILDLILDLFPRCYLESMSDLQASLELQKLPKSPKFIFTSNDFDTNEIFKLWTAGQVEKGTPYFIGQHGNNYGTHRFISPTIEEEIPDVFLTWGWSRDLSLQTPCFNFKQPKKVVSKKRNTSLVLFEIPLENSFFSWCGFHDYSRYMEEQFTFVENLDSEIRDLSIIRLFQPHIFAAGQEVVRWTKFDPLIKLDLKSSPSELVRRTHLAVFSYDSTGILERLSLNLPVIAFWENRFFHIHEEYLDLYEKLARVGIYQPSALDAANFVSKHWNSLDGWWFSNEVQDVVSEFTSNLSRNSERPIFELKEILRDLVVKNSSQK